MTIKLKWRLQGKRRIQSLQLITYHDTGNKVWPKRGPSWRLLTSDATSARLEGWDVAYVTVIYYTPLGQENFHSEMLWANPRKGDA